MHSEVPWFEKAFGRDYLTVYRKRNPAAAVAEVDASIARLGVVAGDRILDLACGAGRHSHLFAERGFRVIGLDLSPDLIRAAADGPGAFVRGDMRRLPFRTGFDAVTMFFTSFGYFGTDPENEAVLRGIARVIRTGGRLLLDYVNRDIVIETLVPESEETVKGARVFSRRRITPDGKRVEKDVRMERPDGTRLTYTESVRLYSPEEMRAMVEAAGFTIASVHGGPDDVPFEPTSARLVIVGRLAC